MSKCTLNTPSGVLNTVNPITISAVPASPP